MDTTYPELKEIWPGWKIVELLGKGLGGTVYRAVRSINGIVIESAVKIIAAPEDLYNPAIMKAEGAREADIELYIGKADDGLNEISCLLKLKSCSHVVNIEDFAIVKRDDAIKWNVYIRMELLRSLTDYLTEKQRLSEDEIIKLGSDLSEALIQCEKNNIIYRDIKLENIYITEEGCFKLGDFGISIKKECAESAIVKGNKNYMAPEMFLEGKCDKTADIYSLGLLMYMLANGNRLPFLGTDFFKANDEEREQAFRRRMTGEKIPDTRYASKELNRIIMKACSHDPDRRYQNAEELNEDLKAIHMIRGK